MTVKQITTVLEDLAPLNFAEDFDNVGLLVGNNDNEVTGILVNLIVSFHPIIFDGLKKLTGKTYVERVVRKAIQNDINIYSMHTALDNAPKGVNAKICEVLGIKNPKILIPKKITDDNSKEKEIGMGMIGSIEKPIRDGT